MRSLKNHCYRKHSKRPHFETIPIDADYIHSRLTKCHTEELIFEHKHYDDGFVHDDNLCNNERAILNSCGLRNCPKCEAIRRMRYERKFREGVQAFKTCKVLTLTFKDHRPLSRREKSDIERQTRNFIKSLERAIGKYKLRYIRVLEIKSKGDLYYYHYHYLADIPYVPQKLISELWMQSTDGSRVVWIESLKNAQGTPIGHVWGRMRKGQRTNAALRYVSKYLSKPMGYQVSHEEYAQLVYGQHFIESRNLTCIRGHNSSTRRGIICPICKEKLYFHLSRPALLEETGSGPPPDGGRNPVRAVVGGVVVSGRGASLFALAVREGQVAEERIQSAFSESDLSPSLSLSSLNTLSLPPWGE